MVARALALTYWRAFLKPRLAWILAISRLLSFKSSEVGTLTRTRKIMVFSVLVYNLASVELEP